MQPYLEKISSLGFEDFRLTTLPSFSLWKEEVARRAQPIHVGTDQPFSCLLILLYPYRLYTDLPPCTPLISAFYPASNRAYHAAKELAQFFTQEGLPCQHASMLPYKPVAQKAGLGIYGKNALQHHPIFGSCFALELLGFTCAPSLVEKRLGLPLLSLPDEEKESFQPLCGHCKRCISLCPTQALQAGTIHYLSCLRFHMNKEVPLPYREKMGLRLLGCDVCNAGCIQNQSRMPYPEEIAFLFSFENLLSQEKLRLHLPAMQSLIGANYARVLPLMRQTALIAGNSGDPSYLPALKILALHPDTILARHAAWSVEKLSAR